MVPVHSNVLSSKCPNPMSSNCVIWDGPAIDGVCAGASITDVITVISNSINPPSPTPTPIPPSPVSPCCAGEWETGSASCYTGDWVDFSGTIPTAGTSPGGFNWSLTNFGVPFPTMTSAENVPEYKWTGDGDLKVRGSLKLSIVPAGPLTDSFLRIPLTTIPTTCFPLHGRRTQTAIVSTDSFVNGNQVNLVTRGFLTIEPTTGILYFNYSFATVNFLSFNVTVHFGSTQFNLN